MVIKSKQSLKNTLNKALSGHRIEDNESYSLISSFEDLSDICEVASGIRNAGKGLTVTYSPKVFIPLTRLCRDKCGYCTFRVDPNPMTKPYILPEEVLKISRAAEQMGCTEVLFTLGERPEQRYAEASKWLNERKYASTLHYLTEMCALVFNQTGLLPHANPGTMSSREMLALKPYNPSLGLMLESTSNALYQNGGPHQFAPSKRPRVRIKTIDIAGQHRIPFTTGILIGIGETLEDRVDSILSIRKSHENHGHIQEIIIQNFRAKPDTAMANVKDASMSDMLWTIAVSRLILGPDMNIQAPPNLNDNYERYLDAGINDWGGISPITIDYVNPESNWPLISQLRSKTESKGYEMRARLPVYPEYFINTQEYLPDNLLLKALSMTDRYGYVSDQFINRIGVNN